jgi:hypothetical protein
MTGKQLAGVAALGAGGWYLLSRSGALQGSGLDLTELGLIGSDGSFLSPAERAQALALRQPAPGNMPIVQSASFVSSGGLAAIGGLGAAALPLLGLGGIALGLTTAGIGLAIFFVSYYLLKQRASMHTNDVRDQWQKQFIDLHHALGLRDLTYEQTKGSGPGNIEMAEVIFSIDHDSSQRLWKAVTQTQDERMFAAAARNIDQFLTANGIPVQDVA